MTDAEQRAALDEIVRIARAHGLRAATITAALREDGAGEAGGEPDAGAEIDDGAPAKTAILTRLLAYVGAMFVFSGLAIFIAMQWDEMSSPARIVATLGSGVALFGMAFAALASERFAVTVTPLFLIAAIVQPIGILVAIDEYSSGGDWRYAALVTSGVLLAQQLVSFVAVRRAVLLFTSLAFGAGFFATGMDLLGADIGLTALVTGASLLSINVGLANGPHRAIVPLWYFLGTGTLLGGLFDLLEDTAIEPAFLGAACGMVYLSTYLRSRSILVVATVAIVGYIGYFTQQRFVDAVGWPLALIAFGLVLLGASALAVRISQRYIAEV